MQKIALIPAYKPEQVIIDIVKSLQNQAFEVVVVDDGSGEKYAPLFEELRGMTSVVSYSENHGKGYALKKGLAFIQEHYDQAVIVTMDADGQHLVTDAMRVCEEVEKQEADLIIGSRKWAKDMPVKSRLGNSLTRQVYRLVTNVKVYDTQSGLRGFSSRLLPLFLTVPGDRYEYEMNVLLEMAERKMKIQEIPISTIYFDKSNSVSHFNALSDSLKIYLGIFKFACSSFFSFLLDYFLYFVLTFLIGTTASALVAANVGARIVSAFFNFWVNKRMVFRTEGNAATEGGKYFLLAMAIMCVNTLLLTGIVSLGCNVYLAKLVVEVLLFLVSFTIQKRYIFKRKEQFCL